MFSSAFMGPDGQFGEFLEGLGPSQLVGRQVLGSPILGDMQIGLEEKQGRLEVEIIRARGLLAKSGSKLLPGEHLILKYFFHKIERWRCIYNRSSGYFRSNTSRKLGKSQEKGKWNIKFLILNINEKININ